ncbi:MAG: rRNA maturation RNase YbeY [Sphaerochaetaceae bacterium]|nr:rRNA maturation RNase YbeY [Sphaerochaetaceae bacterium]
MNTIDVEYDAASYRDIADEEFVISWVNRVLEKVERDNVELSISFVSDEEIKDLNKQYRNLDMPTDILSFVQGDSKDDDDFWPCESEEEEAQVLGDMVISPDAIKRNCENFNETLENELKRLLVHGVLHLIGMDHKTNEFKTEPMLILQEQILNDLREME